MVFLNVSLKKKILKYNFYFLSEVTVGDNNTDKPGMFDLKGKYKWDAWTNNKGKSKEVARQEYIALVKELQAKQ